MNELISVSLHNLIQYCEAYDFKGYDPYDTLNSYINFKNFGKWGPSVAIQLQKHNPINIRPLIGIKKGYNPKGLGLFLKAYCLLYKKTKEKKYLDKADWLFNWLNTYYSKGYSGKCWGYNFDWASPGNYLKAYTPSVVVTSFVVDSILEYYKLTTDNNAKQDIISASQYIIKDIPKINSKEGISFSYTHLSKDCCYNASLLAAEILAKADFVSGQNSHQQEINQAIDFILAKQHANGEWWYSFNPQTNQERKQIDFHQGFILVSLNNLLRLAPINKEKTKAAIIKGIDFYKNKQFLPNGRSFWRLPKKYPVDVHNQSQGIITFSQSLDYNPKYLLFAKTIARWTIENMQHSSGYFFYRVYPFYKNKISYMRWSQAWMMLALSELYQHEE